MSGRNRLDIGSGGSVQVFLLNAGADLCNLLLSYSIPVCVHRFILIVKRALWGYGKGQEVILQNRQTNPDAAVQVFPDIIHTYQSGI